MTDRIQDSAAAVVYSTSTPSICGIDGCQCCPPRATFCECHDFYECREKEAKDA